MRIRIQNFSALFAGIFLLFSGAAELRGHEELPYFAGDRILIDAEIGGQTVRFAYDTGADFTALFGSAADRLKLKTVQSREMPIAGHLTPVGQSESVTVKMLGLETNTKLTILPSARTSWLDGLFSWRDLGAPHLLIDGYDRKIGFLNEAPKGSWQIWNLEKETRQLFFKVTEGGKPFGRVFVDTGASTGLRLAPKLLKQWREENPDAGVSLETFQYLVGDAQVDEIGWAREYRLGDLTFYDVEIGPIPVADEKDGESIDGKGKPFIAMIGARALRRMRMTISAADGEIRIQAMPPMPNHNRLGAVFVPRSKDDPAFVARVLKVSPAAESGLKDGDVLVEIDGTDFRKGRSEGGRLPVHSFTRPAGTALKLKIERAGETREISVTLRDLLGTK